MTSGHGVVGFLDPPQALGMPGDALIAIVSDVGTKERLIAALAKQLDFPTPYGTNWDALEEMLRRLEWLSAKAIIIAHAQLPSLAHPDLVSYVSILRDVNSYWQSRGDRHVIALFPSSARTLLEGTT